MVEEDGEGAGVSGEMERERERGVVEGVVEGDEASLEGKVLRLKGE